MLSPVKEEKFKGTHARTMMSSLGDGLKAQAQADRKITSDLVPTANT